MSQDNIETMRNAYNAFARGDFSQLPFDRQIEWIEPDVEGFWSRGTHHGLEAVIKEVFGTHFGKVRQFPRAVRSVSRCGSAGGRDRAFPGTREGHGKRVECAVCAHLDFAERESHAVPELHRHRKLASGVVPSTY